MLPLILKNLEKMSKMKTVRKMKGIKTQSDQRERGPGNLTTSAANVSEDKNIFSMVT